MLQSVVPGPPALPAAEAAMRRPGSEAAEASAAAAAGDGDGVGGALEAYGASLEAVMAATAGDDAPLDLESVLTYHLAVLEGLLPQVPEPAGNALQQVLDRPAAASASASTIGQ